jgi:solute carrier family 10 (sodium/bile acid cotransporter), member 7
MQKLFDRLSRVGLNAFFLLLVLMVVLAWLFPGLGSADSALPLGTITTYGVSLIFFFYGVSLDPEKLRAGLRNWRLHLVIQLTTFVLFPLVALVILYFFGTPAEPLWLGFYYLAVLPSTVSSSVVMVSMAGGNVPAAIFNASISSIIGIFVTPVWMAVYSNPAAGEIGLADVIFKLCLQVLLPVVVGVLLHKRLSAWTEKNKGWLRKMDQLTILLIVFTAFSASFREKMFDGFTAIEIIFLGMAMLVFFLVMALVMHLLSLAAGFSREDRITIIFCGSKKSIIQGAVMGKVLLSSAALGIILLPLMLYHALQLMAGSIIAQAVRNEKAMKHTTRQKPG